MKTVEVDFTFAKNELFVRQTLAAAFGIPLGQEFTWDSLSAQACDAACVLGLDRLTVSGLSNLAVSRPDEAERFKAFLSAMKARLPLLDVRIVLHD